MLIPISRDATNQGDRHQEEFVDLEIPNVKHWAKTQSTIALSSGEAELHGLATGITQGLGMQSIARDLGVSIGISIHTDATAALIICRRRGLGKIRHLDVTDLWCQEKVHDRTVQLLKVLGADTQPAS